MNSPNAFPPIDQADEDGLLAIGGDLSTEMLLHAYRQGIFPWYNEGEPICWYCPDPRYVLFPDQLIVSKSMRTIISKKQFRFSVNTAFEQVIQQCKTIKRHDQYGTWITTDLQKAFIRMHHLGYAHSAEVWLGNELVGGLYGIRLGHVFFGESMFSRVSNASKYAFIHYVQQLQNEQVQLIDCQVHTKHLESLGAIPISRNEFSRLLHIHTK